MSDKQSPQKPTPPPNRILKEGSGESPVKELIGFIIIFSIITAISIFKFFQN